MDNDANPNDAGAFVEDAGEDNFDLPGSELEFGDALEEPTEEEIGAEGEEGAITPASSETSSPPEGEGAQPVGEQKPVKPSATETQPSAAATTPESPSRPQATPPLHDMIAQHRGEMVKFLAKDAFALPKDQAELFEDPRVAEFVAQNNAGVYLKTMEAVSRLLHATLPTVVRNVSGVTQRASDYEKQFFSANADLNKPEYTGTLRGLLVALRESNPRATPEQLIQQLGPVARAALNLPAKAAGKTPAQNGGGRTRQTVPFVPAVKVAGAAGGRPTKPGRVVERTSNPVFDINNMLRSTAELGE